jgi:hypothetical protein
MMEALVNRIADRFDDVDGLIDHPGGKANLVWAGPDPKIARKDRPNGRVRLKGSA